MPAARRPRAPTVDFHETADLFKALADPIRLHILHELSGTDACVHELCKLVDMSQPSVSHHLRLLRAARLVSTHRKGREIFYQLTDDNITSIVEATRRRVQGH